MNSLISSWTKDADCLNFACFAHEISVLSHCSRNPGICRAMPLHLFQTTAPHTSSCRLKPCSPREWWSRQRERQLCTTAAERNCSVHPHLLHDPGGRSLPDSWLHSMSLWYLEESAKNIEDNTNENYSAMKSHRNLTKIINR